MQQFLQWGLVQLDNIQDIIHYESQAAQYIIDFIRLIVIGEIQGTAKEYTLRGRGIPLMGAIEGKIRPINIDCPFHKVAAHMIEHSVQTKVIQICGDNQLGNKIK